MRFTPMSLSGAYSIHLEPRIDARGTFARAFCAREFAAEGLTGSFVQANISANVRAGTVRGLHFQNAPHSEVKLVQCVKGSVYDVIVDVRKESATYLRWAGICSGKPVTVREVAERIADEFGRRDLLRFGMRADNPVDPPCVVGVRG